MRTKMKMKKNLLAALSVLTLSGLLMTGCGKQNTDTQTPPSTSSENKTDAQTNEISSEMPDASGAQGAQDGALMDVAQLLGKSDDEAKDLFGGGAENKTEDGSLLVGRSYETVFDGNAVTLETIYSDDEQVNYVTVSFTEKTMKEVQTILTEAFGEPETVPEEDGEGEKLTWKQDKVIISLNVSYDMPIADFTLESN